MEEESQHIFTHDTRKRRFDHEQASKSMPKNGSSVRIPVSFLEVLDEREHIASALQTSQATVGDYGKDRCSRCIKM